MQPSIFVRTGLARPHQKAFRHSTLLPGISLAALLAVLSYLLADMGSAALGPIPVSPILVAILLGAAIRNTVGVDPVFPARVDIQPVSHPATGRDLSGYPPEPRRLRTDRVK